MYVAIRMLHRPYLFPWEWYKECHKAVPEGVKVSKGDSSPNLLHLLLKAQVIPQKVATIASFQSDEGR